MRMVAVGGKVKTFSDLAQELEHRGSVVSMIEGTSMLPLLRNGLDAVSIRRISGPPKRGEVVLYRRGNGVFVLHRVVGRNEAGYILRGDNESGLETGVREEDILGVLEGFFRKEHYISCDSLLYRAFSKLWPALYPVRLLWKLPVRLGYALRGQGRQGAALVWLNEATASKKQLLGLSLLALMQGMVFPAIAMTIKCLIDAVAVGGQDALYGYSVLLLFLAVFQALLRFFSGCIAAKTAARLKRKLRQRVFFKVLRSDYLAMADYHSGEIVNRISADTGHIVDTLVYSLPGAIHRTAQLFILTLFIFSLSPWVALVMLGYGVAALAFLGAMREKMQHLYLETRDASGRLNSGLQESVVNLLLIKGAGAYPRVEKQIQTHEERLEERVLAHNAFSLKAYLVVELLLRAGFVALVVWCAFAVYGGFLAVGSLTALALMSLQVQAQFLGFSQSFGQFVSMLASARRLSELEALEREPEGECLRREDAARLYAEMDAITLKGVSYAYGSNPVLKKSDLRIPKGSFTMVSGESGIGKSTFLRLLLGVIRPCSGSILLGAVPVSSSTRSLFACVLQNNSVFSGTVRENVCLLRENATDEEIWTVLDAACAKEFVEGLPNGLESALGEQGAGLSSGQAQRLAIARATLSGAPVLLLDEATSALDAATERQVLQNLKALPGRTIIAVTHREAALQLADVHISLSDGRFVRLN
ncbi:MAG: hypothetical protein DELT_01388 [Desulfovibrio sp.]